MGEGNTKAGGDTGLGEGTGLRNWLRRGKTRNENQGPRSSYLGERVGDGVGCLRGQGEGPETTGIVIGRKQENRD